jgi:hypothetical protein
MAIRKSEVARGVRVVLNDQFVEKCLGDKYLKEEKYIYLADRSINNDTLGDYVHLHGGSGTTSGYAYLNQLDLEFPYQQPNELPYPAPLQKFKGFSRMYNNNTVWFYDDDKGVEVQIKFSKVVDDKRLSEAWELYSKSLKITIEEVKE